MRLWRLWEHLSVLLSIIHGAEKLYGAAGLRYSKPGFEEKSRLQTSLVELHHDVLVLRLLARQYGWTRLGSQISLSSWFFWMMRSLVWYRWR